MSASRVVALLLYSATFAPGSPTTVQITSSLNPAYLGQNVTLTATVAMGAGGSVTFYDGPFMLGIRPLSNGQAKLSTSLLASGTRSITAVYSGDIRNLGSKSPILSETIIAGAANGFLGGSRYAAGHAPYSVAVADFNGDGKSD